MLLQGDGVFFSLLQSLNLTNTNTNTSFSLIYIYLHKVTCYEIVANKRKQLFHSNVRTNYVCLTRTTWQHRASVMWQVDRSLGWVFVSLFACDSISLDLFLTSLSVSIWNLNLWLCMNNNGSDCQIALSVLFDLATQAFRKTGSCARFVYLIFFLS